MARIPLALPFRFLVPLLAAAGGWGCTARGAPAPQSLPPDPAQVRALSYVPDLPVTHPPFDRVHASWKQRLAVPYVFLDHFGSYTETGALIPALHREMGAQGLVPDGPPFCLFYDDPARVPASELRSRACIPVRGPRAVRAPLRYEVLESTTVGYAFVSGLYPGAPRAYPGIFEYIGRMHWEAASPVREIYLVPPGEDPDPAALLCEIQIPARPAAR